MAENHNHMHDHSHCDHDHHAINLDNEARLLRVLVVTGIFMVVEAAGGLITGSLALLADAGHMLADTAALALAWFAFRTTRRRGADQQRSYGYHRMQVLAAFINGVALLAIVVWITVEALQRIMEPVDVMGGPMLVIAIIGLGVNAYALSVLHGGDHGNLNMRAAALHVLGDLLGSVGAIAAAGVILWVGWMQADSVLSILVSLLIVKSTWGVVRKSAHILLEGTPENLDVAKLRASLISNVEDVDDVHHVHVWSLTADRPLLTLHAHVAEDVDHENVLRDIKSFLAERFGINHTTVQIERGHCMDEDTH